MATTKAVPEQLESYKVWTDYLKHLSTLGTGSIVLISTFLEKISPHPIGKSAVILCLVGFLGSVLGSIMAMTAFAIGSSRWSNNEALEGWGVALGGLGLSIAWLGFCVGIVSLTVFAIRNLPN
jgi:hypothetical protein